MLDASAQTKKGEKLKKGNKQNEIYAAKTHMEIEFTFKLKIIHNYTPLKS